MVVFLNGKTKHNNIQYMYINKNVKYSVNINMNMLWEYYTNPDHVLKSCAKISNVLMIWRDHSINMI